MIIFCNFDIFRSRVMCNCKRWKSVKFGSCQCLATICAFAKWISANLEGFPLFLFTLMWYAKIDFRHGKVVKFCRAVH